MSYPLTPMTELDAVNDMLASIGQAPVNTLNVSGIRDVSIAQQRLHSVSREVQSRGWHFNTDTKVVLSLNGSGEAEVPANCLRVDPVDRRKDYVQRNGKLWDKDNLTFTLEEAPKVDIVYFFDFEDLPQAARTYIATRAARLFQTNIIGSRILFEYTAQHEAEAYALLRRAENRTKDTNMLSGSSMTNRILRRQH